MRVKAALAWSTEGLVEDTVERLVDHRHKPLYSPELRSLPAVEAT
jgi:hypothetical protein